MWSKIPKEAHKLGDSGENSLDIGTRRICENSSKYVMSPIKKGQNMR